MRIAARVIGWDHPPYIIAEIGVNHDGSPERAVELAHAAADAGADAIKLQLFEADRLMSQAAKLAAYQQAAGERDPIAMLRRLELSIAQMRPVIQAAHQRGLHAIVSVFSVELVTIAESLIGADGWDAYKTASPDIINKPLLQELANTGKPLIISTGTATIDEVERAVAWLDDAASQQGLAVLQCVSRYPTPMDQAALDGVGAIAGVFDGPVGYSDHTTSVETGARAVLHGACMLEKHLTYDKLAAGPDHAASLVPDEFDRYVQAARMQWAIMRREGIEPVHGGVKVPLEGERDVRHVSRQSLVAARSLPAGHRMTRSDLTIKRPGTGLEPWRLEEVLGCELRRAVAGDHPIQEADVACDAAQASKRPSQDPQRINHQPARQHLPR